MKLMGIDYGEKRVGVALTDDSGKIAFPMCVVENKEDLTDRIVQLAREEKVSGIVLGESHSHKGEPNPLMKKIEKFRERLEKLSGINVYMEPEFMTSEQARQVQEKEEMLDASAAAIILQSYIDKQSHE